MRNRKIILRLLVIFSPFLAEAQTDWVLDTVVNAPGATQVYTDHFNNIYTVNQSTLKKYNSQGLYLKEYNNPGLGNISYINAFNPLNILVYFEEYNQFVFLDNYLNPNLNEFAPADFGFYDAQLASTVDQNSIWFYNQVDDKLHKWSLTQNLVLNSTLQLNQIINIESRPLFIWSTIKNVYLLFPEAGILVFDNFGGFEKVVPLMGLTKFYLTEFNLVFRENDMLLELNSVTREETKTPLPVDEVDDLWLNQNHLVILKKEQLYIYIKH